MSSSNSIYINSHSGKQSSSSSLLVPKTVGATLTTNPATPSGLEWTYPPSQIMQVAQTAVPQMFVDGPIAMDHEPVLSRAERRQAEHEVSLVMFGVAVRLLRRGALRTLQVPTCNVTIGGVDMTAALLDPADRPSSSVFQVLSLHVGDVGKTAGLCGVDSAGVLTLWPTLTKNEAAWNGVGAAGVDGFVMQWLV
jgi:hypothetical protein